MDPADRTGIPSEDAVRAFVEEFIALRADDPRLDPARFCERCPELLRDEVEAQCLAFLVFGRQTVAGPTPGTVLQDFVLLEEIGRGGMGIVYRARRVADGAVVAVKVLPGALASAPHSVANFRREAAAVARLRHPGIVRVHAAGAWQGTWFFAMDFVEGRSLRACIDERSAWAGRTSPAAPEPELRVLAGRGYVAEIAELTAQVAGALHYAHEQGVIHRDVKPQNILIDREGAARLIDFGLAKDLELDTLTVTGQIKGTPVYMSPEQVESRGRGVDRRTDLYSLGVVLYEALTLRRPFAGGTVQEVLRRILVADPLPVEKLNPGVPRSLQTICMKALEKEPRRRYRTGDEFAEDLRRFLRHEPIRAVSAGPVRRAIRRLRRHRALTAAAASVAVFAGALAVWLAVSHARVVGKAGREVELAEVAHASGHLGQAVDHLVAAATLYPEDPMIGQKLGTARELWRNEQEHRQAQAAWAESLRLLALSADCLTAEPSDPGLSLLLALEAARRTPVGFGSRALLHNAILAALRENREVRTLLRHRGAVLSAAFAAGGRRAVTAGEDWTVRVWGTATWNELRTFAQRGPVHAAALSPDGTLVAAACEDGTVRLADVETGTGRRVLRGHTGPVLAVRFGPDGRRLATASEDGTAAVWDVVDGSRRSLLAGHAGAVRSVAFDRAGGRLLTTSNDATFRIWDLATGTTAYESRSLRSPVVSGEFAPDGTRVLLCCGHVAGIWDLASAGFEHRLDHGDWVVGAEFDPDGRRFATATWDRLARVFDARTGELLCTLGGHRGKVNGVRFAPDGRTALTAADDSTARVWCVDPAPAPDLFRALGPDVATAAFSRDGGRLVLSARTEPGRKDSKADPGPVSVPWGVRVHDVATGGVVAELPPLADGTRLLPPAALDPTGTKVLVPVADGSARIFDLSGGKAITLPAGQRPLTCAIFDPAGRRAATSAWDGTIRVHDASDGSLVLELSDPHGRFLAFDPAGERLLAVPCGRYFTADGKAPDGARVASDGSHEYVVGGPANATIWDLRAASVACRIAGESISGAVANPAFDRLLVVTPVQVFLTDAATGATLATLPLRDCLHAAFSRDGAAFVLSLFDGAALLCDGKTGERNATLTGHAREIAHAAFSGDGTRLVTASFDGTARIWDARTGEDLCTLRAAEVPEGRAATAPAASRAATAPAAARPATPVRRVRPSRGVLWAGFSPSGDSVLTIGEDGFARTWPADPVRAAEARRPRDLTTADRGLAGLLTDAEKRASALVERLFDEVPSCSEAAARVRADPGIERAVVDAALRLIAERGDRPSALDRDAWAHVLDQNAGAERWEAAFRMADAANRFVPEHPPFVAALGAALYRAGRFEQARETLVRAGTAGPREAFRLAFLAMSCSRLGLASEAAEALRGAEAVAARDPRGGDLLLAEAKRLVGSQPGASRPGR